MAFYNEHSRLQEMRELCPDEWKDSDTQRNNYRMALGNLKSEVTLGQILYRKTWLGNLWDIFFAPKREMGAETLKLLESRNSVDRDTCDFLESLLV